MESKYTIDNPDNNEYLRLYNEICTADYSGYNDEQFGNKLSFHHVLPRCKYPEYASDPRNHVWIPVMKHIYAHYYLWKSNRIYSLEFWFCYVYFHKNYGYTLSDEEYSKLKKDCSWCRKNKINKKIREEREVQSNLS